MPAGVTLKSLDGSQSVALPFPALSQPVEWDNQQTVYTSGSGDLFSVKLGPTRWRIQRTFQALSETDVYNLAQFLAAVDFAANQIYYCYTDSVSREAIQVACQIVDIPLNETKVHRNNRDVPITFEQLTHPDSVSDAAATE